MSENSKRPNNTFVKTKLAELDGKKLHEMTDLEVLMWRKPSDPVINILADLDERIKAIEKKK